MYKLEQVIKDVELGLRIAKGTDCGLFKTSVKSAEQILELLKEQKWYSVNEKLPDEYDTYFVYTEKGEIYRVQFRPDEDYKDDPYYQWGYVEPDAPEDWVSYYELCDDCPDNILYWRKFPKPPKDGDQ